MAEVRLIWNKVEYDFSFMIRKKKRLYNREAIAAFFSYDYKPNQ